MNRWSIIIHDYMVEDLKLSGVELLVYAVLNGFSAEGGQGYYGSMETLAGRCGCNEKQCRRVIQNLINKKLVQKIERTGTTAILTTVFSPEQQEMFPEIKVEEIEEPRERKDCYKEYREIYKEVRDSLGFKDETPLYGSVINIRFHDMIKQNNVTPSEFKFCLLLMTKDDFIINTLQFELQKILSYNIFNKYLQECRKKITVNKEAENKTAENIEYKKECPVCGGKLFTGMGTCMTCHPDAWEKELMMLSGGKLL